MFSTPSFLRWARSGPVLFASVQTRIPGRPHDRLLEQLQMGFFPALAVLDANGKVIHRLAERSDPAIRGVVRAATDYQRLKPLVNAGEKVPAKRWFRARLGLRKLTANAARQELADLKFSVAERRRIHEQIFSIDLSELTAARRKKSISRDDAADLIYGHFKAGRSPAKRSPHERFFDSLLLHGATRAKDGSAFHSAWPRVEARLEEQIQMLERSTARTKKPASPFVRRLIVDTKKQLESLRARARSLSGGSHPCEDSLPSSAPSATEQAEASRHLPRAS